MKAAQSTHPQLLTETESLRKQVADAGARGAEREQTEEASRLANAYNRSLLEASLDPLVTIGPNGKITDVNAATEVVTGRARAQLIGTDFSDYFTEPEKARAGYQQVFREGLVRDYPLQLRHRDGRVTSVLYNASVYRDESGSVRGVFAAARDITEAEKAKEQLQKAGAYNRSLLEACLDPLVTIGPDGKITDVNTAAEVATGYARAQLIGTDFSDYFTEPEKARAGYQQVFREGFVRDYPLELLHRHGRLTCVIYNASVYRDESGNVIGVFAAARDITERKRAEDEVRLLNAELEQRVRDRTRELEAANKELEAFAYSVSHDLRAPLRSMDGFSQALLEQYAGKLDGEGQDYLRRVRASTVKMSQLIDDLLMLSRVTRREMKDEPVDLSGAARALAMELRKSQPERDVEFVIQEGLATRGDSQLLRLALSNLLGNAWKFTSKRPDARIDFGAALADGKIAYFVRDNGVGFDMAYAGKLFSAFQRLHSTDEFPGTGIGLATVHRVISRHGGRVWAEASVGQGASFYFTVKRQEGGR